METLYTSLLTKEKIKTNEMETLKPSMLTKEKNPNCITKHELEKTD